mgnify:CR=1 FL=1
MIARCHRIYYVYVFSGLQNQNRRLQCPHEHVRFTPESLVLTLVFVYERRRSSGVGLNELWIKAPPWSLKLWGVFVSLRW